MKYRIIHEYHSHFKVSRMCHAMKVSRSGYYAFTKRRESPQAARRRQITEEIKEIHKESRRTYGSPRITRELRIRGKNASRGMVCRIMRIHGIMAKTVKKYKVTTDSNHSLPVAENILNREFKASTRNEKWVSDITYISTYEGWLYLAGILDLYVYVQIKTVQIPELLS